MRIYPRFSDQLVTDAIFELGKIEDATESNTALASILKILVHGEPEVVRTHMLPISDAWMRYELLTELYGAHGNDRDLGLLMKITPDEYFPDKEDIREQIFALRVRIASGWRSKPESEVMTSQYRERMLDKSMERLKSFRRNAAPAIFIFNELCLRIGYGDARVIQEAREMAGDDFDLRDRIVTAIAMGHARIPSPMRARKALEQVSLPKHRIEVLVTIATIESELGQQPVQDFLH
ncbi:hypothetical protein K8R04_02200 [Candidatus Uhrbacteria bacterium]|nr:hypothetical protein [Candidatus Uhrbacteria bacterium]